MRSFCIIVIADGRWDEPENNFHQERKSAETMISYNNHVKKKEKITYEFCLETSIFLQKIVDSHHISSTSTLSSSNKQKISLAFFSATYI